MGRYRIVMRAYPDDYRRRHGDELVDTANELSSRRWSFRQSRSLLIEGLRTRAWIASDGSSSGIWASGIGLAFALWFLMGAARPIAYLLGATGDVTHLGQSAWALMALALVPLAVLTTTTKWPAVLVIAASAIIQLGNAVRSEWDIIGHHPIAVGLSGVVVAVAPAWWMASRGKGRRALSPRAALLLLLALAVGVSYAENSPNLVAVYLGVFIGLPIVGLLLVTIDPRLLIAASVLWGRAAAILVPGALLYGRLDLTTDTILPIVVPTMIAVLGILFSYLGTRRLIVGPGQ